MSILALALWLTVPTTVLVVGAWWIEHRDAAQGTQPTVRPGADPGFDDGLEVDDLPLLDAAELLCVDHPDAIIWERGERR